ncbi:MAG: division/cell wall cluster transcriptional repressor MraZ [Acidimicrobiales bacterium]
MAWFFGRYDHTIDAKGRVVLPAKYRPSFEHGGYLTAFEEGCLGLWTVEDFEERKLQMKEQSRRSRDGRNLARLWSSETYELEMDRQGRLVIPSSLRSYAELQSDVVVVGAMERVEFWSPGRWAEKVQPQERRLTEGTEGEYEQEQDR